MPIAISVCFRHPIHLGTFPLAQQPRKQIHVVFTGEFHKGTMHDYPKSDKALGWVACLGIMYQGV